MTSGSTQSTERLTRNNAVLLLVDHQVGLYTGVRDIDILQLKHNIVALTRSLLALKVPVVVTTTTEKMWGPLIPEREGCRINKGAVIEVTILSRIVRVIASAAGLNDWNTCNPISRCRVVSQNLNRNVGIAHWDDTGLLHAQDSHIDLCLTEAAGGVDHCITLETIGKRRNGRESEANVR